MSRPNSSAPSRYLAPGRARFSMRLWRVGSYGASHGASDALSTSSTTSARPTSARRFLLKRAHAFMIFAVGAPAQSSGARRSGRTGVRSSLTADPRVEEPVREVDDQVDDDEGQREDQHRALQQDVVAREDRLHHQPAEPGPREHGLGEDGAAHELAGLEPEQREDRDEGVAQR